MLHKSILGPASLEFLERYERHQALGPRMVDVGLESTTPLWCPEEN